MHRGLSFTTHWNHYWWLIACDGQSTIQPDILYKYSSLEPLSLLLFYFACRHLDMFGNLRRHCMHMMNLKISDCILSVQVKCKVRAGGFQQLKSACGDLTASVRVVYIHSRCKGQVNIWTHTCYVCPVGNDKHHDGRNKRVSKTRRIKNCSGSDD